MTDSRYTMNRIGASAGITSTCGCRDCGAVIYDRKAHDKWHDRAAAAPPDPESETP